MTTRGKDHAPLLLVALAMLSYGRVWLLHDGIWDDNVWLFSTYASGSLREFLEAGFVELRRIAPGTVLYALLSMHRDTQWFFPVFHSLNLATVAVTPILLYILVKNLWGERPALAWLVAASMVAFALDHTLPYISAINYRLSLLFILASLCLTERAFVTERPRWGFFVLALLTAGVSSYGFLEASLAFEPARLLLIWYVRPHGQRSRQQAMLTAVSYWSPFLLLGLPLVYYKLAYKPYGLYEGSYPGDPLFFLDLGYIRRSLLSIFEFERRELKKAVALDNLLPATLALCAAGLTLFASLRVPALAHAGAPSPAESSPRTPLGLLRAVRAPLTGALVLFIPPTCLFLYAHLPFVGEQHNTHAAPLQIGFALGLGTIFWAAYALGLQVGRPLAIRLCLALLIGSGVFINNKYVDLYFQSWQEQSRFLTIFLNRFPSLPEQRVFFFDVHDDAHFSDLRNSADFEFFLNLLYATSTDPREFHRHHAYSIEQHGTSQEYAPRAVITLKTHWGTDVFDAANFTVVRYRPGELLVNREILARYPDVDYRAWLDKEFPPLPPAGTYVFRSRMAGLDRN